MNPNLSVVIITLNAEDTIRECLESVQFADEIVVVDSGSTDGTLDICREFGARILHQPFLGYGPQKNFGIANATGEWILNVDADERVTAALGDEILIAVENPRGCSGYRIARKNFVGDRWIRHGGWFPDYNLRLFRRANGRFNERAVHEAVTVEGLVGTLREPMLHRTCRDFQEFADRQERYAALGAKELAAAGRRATLLDISVRPLLTFLKMFIIKAGFLDGVNGFKLACVYARYTRSKYRQLEALSRGKS